MVNHTQQAANTVHEKPTTVHDPDAIERIDLWLFRAGGTCRYAEKQVEQFGCLPRATVEMLIKDAQQLIDVCKGALQGGAA